MKAVSADASPLRIEDLHKHYGDVQALRGVSFEIRPGEVFGLLGPNGAGKTTLISILTTLERASRGAAYVFGEAVESSNARFKPLVGVVPQELVSHGFFTVEEVLRFHSGYYGIAHNETHIKFLLERLDLYEHRNKRARQLSGGMKRRLLIAKALVHQPKLLLLDEPTAGVDIELRSSLWGFVRELNYMGTTVLLTTHYLEEAEELCHRVGILDRGKLLEVGDTKQLVQQLTTREITLYFEKQLANLSHQYMRSHAEEAVTFQVPNEVTVGDLLDDLAVPAGALRDVVIKEGSLEDAFKIWFGKIPRDRNQLVMEYIEPNLTWVPFRTLLIKEIRRFCRVIGQTLLIPLINSMLYLLIFGVSLGSRIQMDNSLSYLAFLIPGLVMMGVLNNAFQNTSSSVATSKFHGDLEDLRRVPLMPSQIVWAMSLGGLARGLMVGVVVFTVGQVFHWILMDAWLGVAHPLVLLSFLFVGGVAFSQLGILVAFWAKHFDQLSTIGGFVLLPLMYLGGVFFSLDGLHPFWQWVSKFNPLLYFMNGVRYGMIGMSDVPLWLAYGVSLLALAVLNFGALTTVKHGSYSRW